MFISAFVPSGVRCHSLFLRPRQTEFVHLNCKLKYVVDALALGLRLVHIVAPDVANPLAYVVIRRGQYRLTFHVS